MATTRQSELLEGVPETWFEPVVGLWVVVLAIAGIVLTLGVVEPLLAPLGGSTIGAVLVTTGAGLVSYGLFGYGATYGYLTHRHGTPEFVVERFDRSEWHWVGGLAALAVLLVVVGGVWTSLAGRSFEVVTPHLMLEPVPIPDGWGALTLDVAGVNEIVTFAPLVFLHALVGGILIAPAVGVLFHGVLQTTLARVTRPRFALAGTALAVSLTAVGFSYYSITAPRGFGAAVVAFVFALAVAYAYRETGNLLVTMAAYGSCSAITFVAAWLTIVAQLYAHYGHL